MADHLGRADRAGLDRHRPPPRAATAGHRGECDAHQGHPAQRPGPRSGDRPRTVPQRDGAQRSAPRPGRVRPRIAGRCPQRRPAGPGPCPQVDQRLGAGGGRPGHPDDLVGAGVGHPSHRDGPGGLLLGQHGATHRRPGHRRSAPTGPGRPGPGAFSAGRQRHPAVRSRTRRCRSDLRPGPRDRRLHRGLGQPRPGVLGRTRADAGRPHPPVPRAVHRSPPCCRAPARWPSR